MVDCPLQSLIARRDVLDKLLTTTMLNVCVVASSNFLDMSMLKSLHFHGEDPDLGGKPITLQTTNVVRHISAENCVKKKFHGSET